MQQINKQVFQVQHKKIEDVAGHFYSAVSLQSFYAWSNPEMVLKHVYNLLLPSRMFVLATPNLDLDQIKLFKAAEKELVWHPYFEKFRTYNIELAQNPNNNFT